MGTAENIGVEAILAALARHEIQVYYQPLYDVLTNRVKGAEALARWVKPDGTVLSPGLFVPLLEQSNMICELDWYMLNEVCAFLKQFPETQRHHISVNFSRWHFENPDFLGELCRRVDSHGLPHRLISVEITESAAVEYREQLAEWVKGLQDADFRVEIDDFGSGLSSLGFLKDVPVDVLKIDRSLISGNCQSDRERALLECIFHFAHRLNMSTVTEGVETEEQLSFIRTSGCKLAQGFLMARPMPGDQYRALYVKQNGSGEDVLLRQSAASVQQLLMEAVFTRFPMIIFANLTRNSYYMMAYEDYTTRTSPAAGVYDELIQAGIDSMHPDDKEKFANATDRTRLLEAYAHGQRTVSVTTRQMGDDGVYRSVETADYFVTNPSTDDVLIIALCHHVSV